MTYPLIWNLAVGRAYENHGFPQGRLQKTLVFWGGLCCPGWPWSFLGSAFMGPCYGKVCGHGLRRGGKNSTRRGWWFTQKIWRETVLTYKCCLQKLHNLQNMEKVSCFKINWDCAPKSLKKTNKNWGPLSIKSEDVSMMSRVGGGKSLMLSGRHAFFYVARFSPSQTCKTKSSVVIKTIF